RSHLLPAPAARLRPRHCRIPALARTQSAARADVAKSDRGFNEEGRQGRGARDVQETANDQSEQSRTCAVASRSSIAAHVRAAGLSCGDNAKYKPLRRPRCGRLMLNKIILARK